MADTKISGLTTDAAPQRTNDFAPTYDASATATKKVALRDFGVYEYWAGFSNASPADATTYYFGMLHSTVLQATATARLIAVNRAGIITRVQLNVVNTGTAGSAETSSIYIRANNTTDTLITSSLVTNAFSANAYTVSVSFALGGFFEIKWVTPTWATNPTGLYMNLQLLME